MKVNFPSARHLIALRDMKPGEVGTFMYGAPLREILALRVYNAVVNLKNPAEVWDLTANHQVSLLPVGTKIELEVE